MMSNPILASIPITGHGCMKYADLKTKHCIGRFVPIVISILMTDFTTHPGELLLPGGNLKSYEFGMIVKINSS